MVYRRFADVTMRAGKGSFEPDSVDQTVSNGLAAPLYVVR